MESMAMEIAAVSTAVSGIPELIADGKSGLLVPEKNPTALADALQRLLEDEDLRGRVGHAGRQKVRRDFDVYKNAARLAGLFQESGGRQA
jgi:glycosyltransferase involved in cell wall biosynthesis